MRIDPVHKVIFSDFYDLVRQPRARKKRKCMRCSAPTMGDHLCNKCAKFASNQSRLVQDGDVTEAG